jgi:hypothetical protein
VGRKLSPRFRHDARNLLEDRSRDSRLFLRVLEGVASIEIGEDFLEALERRRPLGPLSLQVLPPVPPPSHEIAVVELLLDEVAGDREEDRRLTSGVGCEPVIGVGRRVRKAHVEHDELCPLALRFHDALGVGVEIVAGLEVGAHQ